MKKFTVTIVLKTEDDVTGGDVSAIVRKKLTWNSWLPGALIKEAKVGRVHEWRKRWAKPRAGDVTPINYEEGL